MRYFLCLVIYALSLSCWAENHLTLSPYVTLISTNEHGKGKEEIRIELKRLGAVRLDGAQKGSALPMIVLSPRQLRAGSISKLEVDKQLAQWALESSMSSWKVEGPDYVTLNLAAEKVDLAALEAKAGEYLNNWLVDAGFQEIKVKPVSTKRRSVLVSRRVAEIRIRPLEVSALSRRLCIWADIVDASGVLLNSAPVWFDVSAMGEVWTPSTDAEKGTAVDVHPLKREFIDVAAAGIEPASRREIEGKEFSRRVESGQPITKDVLRAIPEIKNGDIVFVEVRVGTVFLRSRAEAMHDAYIGDRIKLKSVSSGETMLGVVLSAGRVWIGS
ncbi:Flagellar basal body P-ring biosynthesis protein [Hahella chejuensis KCTC 2396]|uniref:Flagellar basal body P-ring biosynthesis protein n=1 Tax=Hahella chejuensis (strain KCTC 2396) TaxID=349521 RepID=Q2SEX7_HAHCH|nr:flagellar basal body P-ring formation chaperone FlgA [Hahella chejuensis]ABC30797.1 Flagellar basal body P-ring biosynthesis protein [Hahella chejuensis KCTC 2396]